MIALDDIDLALVVERQAERERDALDRGELAVERAKTLRIAGHVVKKNRRRAAAAFFGEHVGDGAHLDVPMGAADALELAEFFDLLKPPAQAAVAALPLCRRRARHAHLRVAEIEQKRV